MYIEEYISDFFFLSEKPFLVSSFTKILRKWQKVISWSKNFRNSLTSKFVELKMLQWLYCFEIMCRHNYDAFSFCFILCNILFGQNIQKYCIRSCYAASSHHFVSWHFGQLEKKHIVVISCTISFREFQIRKSKLLLNDKNIFHIPITTYWIHSFTEKKKVFWPKSQKAEEFQTCISSRFAFSTISQSATWKISSAYP